MFIVSFSLKAKAGPRIRNSNHTPPAIPFIEDTGAFKLTKNKSSSGLLEVTNEHLILYTYFC